jgi:hypothetical protein
MNILTKLCSGLIISLAVLCGATVTHAATVMYSFTIEGTMLIGDETYPNAFGLTAGETIEATGFFTADLGTVGSETGTVSFHAGSGNTLSIDLNGYIITAADDTRGVGSPSLTFLNGGLTDFNYLKTTAHAFNSSFGFFDNLADESMLGEWTSSTLTVVPVPAAVWLLGSGLLGLVGIARRKART